MTKTEVLTIEGTHTRTLEEIAEDYANVSDSGSLVMNQCRLAYEWVRNAEGAEASMLKEKFAKAVTVRLASRHEDKVLTVPAITNMVNAWKYMLLAEVEITPDVAKASYGLASQSLKDKDTLYVAPAIEKIRKGANAVTTFNATKKKLRDDKAKKVTPKPNDGTDKKDGITLDTLLAELKFVTKEFVGTLTIDQNNTLKTALTAALAVVA